MVGHPPPIKGKYAKFAKPRRTPNPVAPKPAAAARPVAPKAPKYDPYAPLTPDQITSRAQQDVYGPYNSMIDSTVTTLVGQAAQQAEARKAASSKLIAALQPYAAKIRGYTGTLAAQPTQVAGGVASGLTAQGQQLSGEIGGKLAQIQAPGQATAQFAGGAERVGAGAAGAISALGSAESEKLHGIGEANAGYAAAMPGVEQLQALKDLGLIQGDLSTALIKQTGDLQIEAQKAYMAAVKDYRDAEWQKSQARSQHEYQAAQLKLSAARQKAADAKQAYNQKLQNAKLGLSAQATAARIAQGNARVDISRGNQQLAAGRLGVSQTNAQTSQARLQQDWAKHLDSLGIKGAQLKLAQQREARLQAGGPKKGGFTAHQVQQLKADAYDSARDGIKGWTEDQTTAQINAGLEPVVHPPQKPAKVLQDLVGHGIPFSIAVRAVAKFFPAAKAWYNPKASAVPSGGAEGAAQRWGGTTSPGGPIPGSPNPVVNRILTAAHGQIGTPYVWGAESPRQGFDCSGLIDWAYRQAGIDLPGRMTTYTARKMGHSVPASQIQPGDVLITNGGEHMVMYVGNGRVIAAPHTGEVVQYQPVSRFARSVVDIRRLI